MRTKLPTARYLWKNKKSTRRRRVLFYLILLPEVSLQQTLKGLAVAGLVKIKIVDKPTGLTERFPSPLASIFPAVSLFLPVAAPKEDYLL